MVSHRDSLTGTRISVAEVLALSGSFQTACSFIQGHFIASDLGLMASNVWIAHIYAVVSADFLPETAVWSLTLLGGLVTYSDCMVRLVVESGKWVWPKEPGPGKAQASC